MSFKLVFKMFLKMFFTVKILSIRFLLMHPLVFFHSNKSKLSCAHRSLDNPIHRTTTTVHT